MEFRNQILETLEIVSEAGALAAVARGPQGRLGAATTADRNAAPSIRPQSERRGIWNRSAASPATLKIATRLPASGEIDARAGGELVEARGLAIVLRKAATALFPKGPEIELSVSVALVGGEFVEAHEALQASAAAARKPAQCAARTRSGVNARGAAATGSPLRSIAPAPPPLGRDQNAVGV